MAPPVRRPAHSRGWLALLVSLALHGALVVALARLPGRAETRRAAADGPAVMELVEEAEAPAFLAPTPGPAVTPAQPAKSAGGEAVIAVGVRASGESITPAVHHTEPTPAAAPVDPAVFGAPGDGSGPAAGGAPALFESGTPARSVVYVIDRSSSMGPGGLLEAATRELCASLARLPPATQFQIILYHDQPEALFPGRAALLPATAANVQRAARLLVEVRAEGGTDHLRALRLALSLGPEVIYLLTDADDLSNADRHEVTRLNRGRAVIHTIELSTSNRGRTDMPLQVLARENRGTYRAADLGPQRAQRRQNDE